MIYIKFEKDASLRSVFDGDLSTDNIVTQLKFNSRFSHINFADSKRKLFIFDEIQVCPNAIASLKFFSEDKRYDCIATRSPSPFLVRQTG